MGRRTLRALGAGLMEVGNQARIQEQNAMEERKLALEKQRQENLLRIAEGRQSLMREQLDLSKETNAASRADTMEEKFYTRASKMIDQVYGKDGITEIEAMILKAQLEGGGTAPETMAQMVEMGMLSPTSKPDTKRLEQLYDGLKNQWKATIGKGKDAPEFNLNTVLTMFPTLYTGLEGAPVPEGGEKADEEPGLMSRIGTGIADLVSGNPPTEEEQAELNRAYKEQFTPAGVQRRRTHEYYPSARRAVDREFPTERLTPPGTITNPFLDEFAIEEARRYLDKGSKAGYQGNIQQGEDLQPTPKAFYPARR